MRKRILPATARATSPALCIFCAAAAFIPLRTKDNEKYLLPSAEEIDRASRLLASHGDRVDYIVTHDAPVRLQRFIDIEDADHLNHLHTFLEEVSKTIDFRFWYCGKYHQNRIIPPRYHMLFTDVVKGE